MPSEKMTEGAAREPNAESTISTADRDAGIASPLQAVSRAENQDAPSRPKEIGGRDGPEPTRFGDWEKGGRCIDF
jgi:hypothetical protein